MSDESKPTQPTQTTADRIKPLVIKLEEQLEQVEAKGRAHAAIGAALSRFWADVQRLDAIPSPIKPEQKTEA